MTSHVHLESKHILHLEGIQGKDNSNCFIER